jgi:hypothetical protein
MSRRLAFVVVAVICGGCRSGGSIRGQLIDARTGSPVTHGRVSLSPTEAGSCSAASVPTDGDGAFVADGLCANERYRLESAAPYAVVDPQLATPGDVSIRVEAWALPASDGAWLQIGGELVPLSSATVVDTLPLSGDPSEGVVRVPVQVPTSLPRIDGGDALVLAGKEASELRIEPVSAAGSRSLGTPDSPVAMGPWWYIGATTAGERLQPAAPVTPEATHVQDVSLQGRQLRFVAASALPGGVYALTGPTGGRALLVVFGPDAPGVAEAD